MQGHQVADWVEHGLNLPQYEAAFRRSAITVWLSPDQKSRGLIVPYVHKSRLQ
jgi:hypothetical protein